MISYTLRVLAWNKKVAGYLWIFLCWHFLISTILSFKMTAVLFKVTFTGRMTGLTRKAERTKIRGTLQVCLKSNLNLMQWNEGEGQIHRDRK